MPWRRACRLELREHVAVVLLGHHGFVARLPVVAGDDGVERLGGVARDAELRRASSRPSPRACRGRAALSGTWCVRM